MRKMRELSDCNLISNLERSYSISWRGQMRSLWRDTLVGSRNDVEWRPRRMLCSDMSKGRSGIQVHKLMSVFDARPIRSTTFVDNNSWGNGRARGRHSWRGISVFHWRAKMLKVPFKYGLRLKAQSCAEGEHVPRHSRKCPRWCSWSVIKKDATF